MIRTQEVPLTAPIWCAYVTYYITISPRNYPPDGLPNFNVVCKLPKSASLINGQAYLASLSLR
jgi:hypothetical protein